MDKVSTTQRITRLTPLGDVLAAIEKDVVPVKPGQCALAQALGCTLAEDVTTRQLPSHAVALRDGIAVEAAVVADASPYAPVPLASKPRRVDAGDPMPQEADAVLPLDAVNERGDRAVAIAAVAPGEGVLPAGGDASPQRPLRSVGERLRRIDLAVMVAAGVTSVMARAPRVCIACGSADKAAPIEAALAILAQALWAAGAEVLDNSRHAGRLDEVLTDAHSGAVIAVGGTGSGRRDAAVQTLARLGRVEAHGIAVSPGETAAFGFVGARPVLLIPGRLDAALSIWLQIGRHLIAKLAGGGITDAPALLPLRRKVTSAIGLAELIPVRCKDGMAEPLGSGYLSLAALAKSDGWIVAPADSEGFSAETMVAVHPWP